jgi:hypothetical protein
MLASSRARDREFGHYASCEISDEISDEISVERYPTEVILVEKMSAE